MIATNETGPDKEPVLVKIRTRLHGKNINEQTLLAADRLNHFNEIVMTQEMVPEFLDLLDEVKDWWPKSYTKHFQISAFSDKVLAIETFGHVPERYRTPF